MGIIKEAVEQQEHMMINLDRFPVGAVLAFAGAVGVAMLVLLQVS